MAFIVANKAAICGVLFAVSELLAVIPAIKSNSIFELAVGLVKWASGK